jgi:CarD family transcriptional regulator
VVFQIGDKVVYPNHGIGVVESIDSRATEGGRVSGYALRILANDSRVFVPQGSADGVGLRRMINGGDVRKILSLLADGTIDQHPNWKGRFKENSDKMRSGSLFEVANVLKGLTFVSRKKVLSFREKRMLERAKFLVVSEIAEVEGRATSSVEETVDRALAKTFASEPRPVRQRPVAGKLSNA